MPESGQPLPLLRSVLLLPLESILNRVLALDSRSQARLAPYEGRTLALHCLQPSAQLFLTIRGQGLRLSPLHSGPCAATLTGPARALAALLLRGGKVDNLHGLGVELRGDTAFVQALQILLRELDPDWEHRLARILGDVPSALLADTLRTLRAQWRHTDARLRENGRDFLCEESGLLVSPAEHEAFATAITELVLRVDRLQARVGQLAANTLA